MSNKDFESLMFILAGVFISLMIFLEFIKLPELFMILSEFVGLAMIINGCFNLAESHIDLFSEE